MDEEGSQGHGGEGGESEMAPQETFTLTELVAQTEAFKAKMNAAFMETEKGKGTGKMAEAWNGMAKGVGSGAGAGAKGGLPAAPASLGGSFQIANKAPVRRLVVAVDALEKEGKTNFALTAPGPIAYLGSDIGDEGVVEKFQTAKLIHRADYGVIVPAGNSLTATMDLVLPEWERFVKDYKLALSKAKAGLVRTIVLDTASEFWEMLRLARFGKLTQVMPHHYTALNAEYQNIIREVFDTPANMVLLHKLKAEWKEGAGGKANKTGGYERAGFSNTGFLVQCNVLAWREKDETGAKTGPFHITVRDCRQNATVAGMDLVSDLANPLPEFIPQANFASLGVSVYPESSMEEWQ